MHFQLSYKGNENVDCSPSAEHLFDHVDGVEAKSVGISVEAAVPLTKQLMEWADLVVIMEHEHKKAALFKVGRADRTFWYTAPD